MVDRTGPILRLQLIVLKFLVKLRHGLINFRSLSRVSPGSIKHVLNFGVLPSGLFSLDAHLSDTLMALLRRSARVIPTSYVGNMAQRFLILLGRYANHLSELKLVYF